VVDAVIISAFWDGTMCHSLVHKLGREQSKTTKVLLNIATRHASGEERRLLGPPLLWLTWVRLLEVARLHPPVPPSKESKRALRARRRGKSDVCVASLQ
jgi:hypothetical protein